MPASPTLDDVQIDPQAAERAMLHVMSLRRRRVLRTVLTLLGILVVMVLITMATRDAQNVSLCRVQVDFAVDAFNRLGSGDLPLLLPKSAAGPASVRDHFAYTPTNAALIEKIRPVAVCVCAQPHPLFLRAQGRHLILFDGQRYSAEWVTESELQGRAERLGLHLRQRR
ncbi:MAG: hypothetical protein CHACPFDD_01404 [Phycisphaerae bacterium]|nr:hypothetical protein [Phycisphaerae bacterium]